MFTSKEAQCWHMQGEDKLARKCQEKCLYARGFIPKSKNQEITDARLFAYSPDTQKVRIRVECDYKPFWIEISFCPLNTTSMNFEACGCIDVTFVKLETPYIVHVSEAAFTIEVKCKQIPSFWMHIDVPFAKINSFIKTSN